MKTNTEGSEEANPMPGVTEQTLKNCEEAIRNGLKFQQEIGRYWTGVLGQAASPQDWQKRVNNLATTATSLVPAGQKRMEEIMDLADKNNKAGADLWKKATEAAQTPSLAESQAKWTDVWTSAVRAARSNAEAAAQINTRAWDAWMEFAQKNVDAAQIRVEQAA